MNLLLCLALTLPGLPGITTEFSTFTCAGEDLADETRAEWLDSEQHPSRQLPEPTDDWWPVDSLFVCGEIAPAKRLVLSHDPNSCTLELYFPLDTLPSLCQQALDYAPEWLEPELASSFRRLGDSAEFYADLLLNAPERQVDEVAFCIANMGPEVLTHRLFDPDLLLVNAEYLYLVDDSLQYADIVDYGAPPGDYYSTVSYAVLEGADTAWYELPRDIYYHYIVHPTSSDELPRMDSYVLNQHWREYFFFEADSGYPVLCDHIKQAKVLWNRAKQVLSSGRPFEPDDCALDVIGNWATRTVPSAASGNRPIHPNVIAHEHNGNCGELQDLLTAACRTCLIPVVNTMDPCEDHVWCEFWDEGWCPYQVDLGFGSTHIADTSIAYDEQVGGSKRVSSIWNWRPDGFWWTVTSRYSNTCSLHVRVLDQRGLPVDAARVVISSEGWTGGFATTTIGFTDRTGAAGFELGDLRNFYCHISTPLAEYPGGDSTVKIIGISQTGAHYYKTFYIPAPIPAPKPRPEPCPWDTAQEYKVKLDLALEPELDYGYCVSRGAGSGDPDDSVRFYQYYSDPNQNPELGPSIDLFITDAEEYGRYLAAERFGAFWLGDETPEGQPFWTFPENEKPFLILSSEDKLFCSRWLDLTARLYIPGIGIAEQPRTALLSASWPTVQKQRLSLDLRGIGPPGSLLVYDVSGTLALKQDITSTGCQCRADLPAGIYLVHVETPDATVLRKVVVLR